MNADPTLALYERWAPRYPPAPHNPLMRAEQAAMMALWPTALPSAGHSRALDLACGTGRYTHLLTMLSAAEVVALDFSAAMLRQVSAGHIVCASMMHLPFVDGAFGFVVSGLAVGHSPRLDAWMSEVARVLQPGGVLLYSDFHPEAARAGLTRSFKDEADRTHTLPHHDYSVAEQLAAAERARLSVEDVQEVRVGLEMQEHFEGCEKFYRQWHGLPLVLVVRAHKDRA